MSLRVRFMSAALAAIIAASLAAAPPKLTIPSEVRPSGQYAVMVPETDAVSVLYIGLDGIDPIPPQLLNDKRTFALDCYGKTPGAYRFVAVGAGKDGEQVRTDFILVVPGKAPTPEPPKDPPVKDPPKDPPTNPAPKVKLFFLVIRDAAPAPPEFTRIMDLKGWKDLRAAGHSVLDVSEAEALAKYQVKLTNWNRAPVVVVLRNKADRTGSEVVKQPVPLPTTDEGIAALAKEVAQ